MCDTFVALPDATADGSVIFAKNSDRPAGEGQHIERHAPARHEAGARLRCTYIDIPQTRETFGVLLSRIDWMWGAEMGANEAGVAIGNEAVWTTEPHGPPALLGMDLVRLGLERGETAEAALSIMIELLETHGQGGACAEADPGFTYHNSFLIADRREAWVLETAGPHWVAEHVTGGVRNISNALTVRRAHRRHGAGLADVDFAARFSADDPEPHPLSRQACGAALLRDALGSVTPETMMATLRDHDAGICMHGAFETTSAQVSRLSAGGDVHWFTPGPHPCRQTFREWPVLRETRV